MIEIWMFGS